VSYSRNAERGGTLTMTAPAASMLVTHDYLDPAGSATRSAASRFAKAAARGSSGLKGGHAHHRRRANGYGLYGVERVGSRRVKFFGQHDWYRELATARQVAGRRRLLEGGPRRGGQHRVHVLFLCAAAPIIMSKLRVRLLGQPPERTPPTLAGFVGSVRAANAQLAGDQRRHRRQQWLDSPILEISGHKAIKFLARRDRQDSQLARRRDDLHAGRRGAAESTPTPPS